MKAWLPFCAWLVFLTVADARGAEQPPPLDGPHRPMQDELLDHLVGEWKLTGKMGSRPVENQFQAAWVLNHQFLQLHFQDAAPEPKVGHVPYEAMVYVGYDNASARYVAHWIDVFGGRFSETLGYGSREGNALKLTFEYPDGPFHNTMTWNPEAQSWHFLLQQKNAAGDWEDFAVEDLQKLKK